MSAARFRINAEHVVHETVEGEVIAIDLANGSYYSVAGSGTAVWRLLVRGADEAEICAVLSAQFDGEAEAIRSEVAGLIEKLRDSDLVVASEEPAEGAAPDGGGEGDGAREPFEPPRFERYTDMKDYFLLDPIHEVDAAGWPRPAA